MDKVRGTRLMKGGEVDGVTEMELGTWCCGVCVCEEQ